MPDYKYFEMQRLVTLIILFIANVNLQVISAYLSQS